jgi:hypothetical protein
MLKHQCHSVKNGNSVVSSFYVLMSRITCLRSQSDFVVRRMGEEVEGEIRDVLFARYI